MKIFIPKETTPGENRISMIPALADKLVKLGASLEIESSLGTHLGFSDEAYTKVGCSLSKNRQESLSQADMVCRLRKPAVEEVSSLKKGAIHVSYLDPFNEKTLVGALASQGVSAISMEMIPRSTRAQKMDSLSSQASLGGYVAVIVAAQRLPKIFPMMMTPAGTLAPAKVFIIGAGVAGLQAIATAKRMGARVEAFDTRPVVEEQVKSLGGQFVKIDLGETGQTAQGYAKELTPEQLAKQKEGMKKHCSQADVVITTAQIFGRKAPVLITTDMIQAMKPGSVVIDMAVETGGNVEGSVKGEEVDVGGVKIVGIANLPGLVAQDASKMYASNLYNLIQEFWDKTNKKFQLNLSDDILKSCVVCHEGKVLFG
ncbi:MAG TPA: Re/Si-specific NAD(P)(+) transhydrogenase subunit alpha [Deltaproteobacteria bacterium]|nr:MAG: NAD(P) transhydrogenase subunit alpha [Deltaproteobacteria bacterium GWA2_45_12]HBF13892.1 Re/Si-specific NAD(P)(+) transhydrogenase subunit alpha [Deltaproteobacteria bacterium]